MKLFGLLVTLANLAVSASYASDSIAFPLRAQYPSIATVEAETLARDFQSYLPIDLRTEREFAVMHIAGAQNIQLGQKLLFLHELARAAKSSPAKRIVLYCGSPACRTSYDAAIMATQKGMANIAVFDGSISNWGRAMPAKTVLLGASPADPSKLIPESELAKRLLPRQKFEQQIKDKQAVVIDARGPQLSRLPYAEATALTFEDVIKMIEQKINQNKILYIVDVAGQQAAWIQYYLEKNGYKDYFFLEGGAQALSLGRVLPK